MPKEILLNWLDSFIKGATEAGHTVEKINLNQTEVKGASAATPVVTENRASRRMDSTTLYLKSKQRI